MNVEGVTLSCCSGGVAPTTAPSVSLVPVVTTAPFRDDFDGDELNRTVWNVEVNCDGGGNGEAQCYVDDDANLRVEDGKLHLVASRAADGTITSGRINTRGRLEVAYGRWEARVKVPGVDGTWPAFWTLGHDFGQIGWPACGEIVGCPRVEHLH